MSVASASSAVTVPCVIDLDHFEHVVAGMSGRGSWSAQGTQVVDAHGALVVEAVDGLEAARLAEFDPPTLRGLLALAAQGEHARTQVERVRRLHEPVNLYPVCENNGCESDDCFETSVGEWVHGPVALTRVCSTCFDEDGDPREWPCPSIRELEDNSVTYEPAHTDVARWEPVS